MKKYKEDAYKGYLKYIRKNQKDNKGHFERYKLAKLSWVDSRVLQLELESPWVVSAGSKGRPSYLFDPRLECTISFGNETNRTYAKELVYSAFCRMDKELDELGEQVGGRPQ